MYDANPSLWLELLNDGHGPHLAECFAKKAFQGASISLVEYLCQGALNPKPKILMEYPFRISLGWLKFDPLSWDGYFQPSTVSTVSRFVEVCDVLRAKHGWIVSPSLGRLCYLPLRDAARRGSR